MFTSIEDFKKNFNNSPVTETKQPISTPINHVDSHPKVTEQFIKVEQVCQTALQIGLCNESTVKIITDIYTDESKAPENVNVKFVKENLDQILYYIDQFPKNNTINYQFTSEMLSNKLPSECVVYVEHEKIKQLCEALNVQIQKNEFKAIYENNIFFINDIDKLNDNNKKIVFAILKETQAKNISTQLKWTRIIS